MVKLVAGKGMPSSYTTLSNVAVEGMHHISIVLVERAPMQQAVALYLQWFMREAPLTLGHPVCRERHA